MKRHLRTLLFCVATVSACTVAHATLIGDTITLTHIYTPHPNSPLDIQTTTVTAGTADAKTLIGRYTVNPEADSILVNFLGGPNGWGTGGINGLVVSDIDDTITGVSVSTNLAGWVDSRLTFDAHSITSNWEALPFSSSSYFNLTLTLSGATSVADPGSTLLLLTLPLAGFVGLRRKFRAIKN